MKLAPLKYKNYVWPHNPRTYIIDFEKNIVEHEYPYSNLNEVEDLGMKPREMNGEGEFVGPGAYDEFKKLASIFYSKGPGPLIHPLWDISDAIFKSLKLEQEPTPDFVKYSFSFVEDNKGTKISEVKKKETNQTNNNIKKNNKEKINNKKYSVKKGDSLWAISKRNNIKLNDLIKKNPQIKNPNLIFPGQKINL